MTMVAERARAAPSRSILNDPKVRGLVAQVVLALVVGFLVWFATTNAIDNLRRSHIASGFGFLNGTANFDISQKTIPFDSTSSNGRALLVGLLNTLIASAAGIVFATVIGLVIGVARLSTNWLVAKIATVYIEIIRNIPPLLQLLFWYLVVLRPLPPPNQSLSVASVAFLNSRGLYVPAVDIRQGGLAIAVALVAAIVGALVLRGYARRRQDATGRRFPVLWAALALIIALPVVAGLVAGADLSVNVPIKGKFNLTGGVVLAPEIVALVLGLSLYTAAFIAEIVRGGILAVARGQSEAARAVGLSGGLTMRLVILPQALRVIVPPLANQYLNLTKNTSLAVAVGYPELFLVFGGSVLNQTGQAIECISITMGIYLVLSLLISAFMNWFNRRVALVER